MAASFPQLATFCDTNEKRPGLRPSTSVRIATQSSHAQLHGMAILPAESAVQATPDSTGSADDENPLVLVTIFKHPHLLSDPILSTCLHCARDSDRHSGTVDCVVVCTRQISRIQSFLDVLSMERSVRFFLYIQFPRIV